MLCGFELNNATRCGEARIPNLGHMDRILINKVIHSDSLKIFRVASE